MNSAGQLSNIENLCFTHMVISFKHSSRSFLRKWYSIFYTKILYSVTSGLLFIHYEFLKTHLNFLKHSIYDIDRSSLARCVREHYRTKSIRVSQ